MKYIDHLSLLGPEPVSKDFSLMAERLARLISKFRKDNDIKIIVNGKVFADIKEEWEQKRDNK